MVTLHRRPLRLGLTGGIGSGKSTVAQMLVEFGAILIDADRIARDLTGPQGAAMAAIRAAFGADFIDASGALNRARMRQLVFTRPQARAQLEGIVHPLVALHGEREAQQASEQGARCLLHDIPLLAESGQHWLRRLDAVLVVDCCAATQTDRVMRRSGLTQAMVQEMIAAQASRSARRALADMLIVNEAASTLQDLRAQVRQAAARLGL